MVFLEGKVALHPSWICPWKPENHNWKVWVSLIFTNIFLDIVRFDNTYSWVRKKTIEYRLDVTFPSETKPDEKPQESWNMVVITYSFIMIVHH